MESKILYKRVLYKQVNRYQKHSASIYGNKLVSIDDMFSKHLKTFLGRDAVYNFI